MLNEKEKQGMRVFFFHGRKKKRKINANSNVVAKMETEECRGREVNHGGRKRGRGEG